MPQGAVFPGSAVVGVSEHGLDAAHPGEAPLIREAREADVPEMIALLEELFALEPDFAVDKHRQERGLRLLMESATGMVWVAELGNRTVGMCTLQKLISTAEGGEVGLLEDLVVAESCRGKGIGLRLLAFAEDWARVQGLSRLQLLADRENSPALGFYGKQGWAPTRLIALRRLPAERGNDAIPFG